MMKWTTIGDVFKIASGGTPQSSRSEYYDNGDIPWVNTGDLKSRHLTIDKITKKITKPGLENSAAKLFPANTVLVALYGASIGNCSILKTGAATNQACAALLPNKEQSEEFLYFYILSIQQQLINKGQGGGQPNISAEILKRIKYPLLPLETQQQIVAVLDKAQNIIDKRKTSLQLLDQLLRDTFLDMFGDPVSNSKKWPVLKLSEVGKLERGVSKSRPRNSPELLNGPYPLVQTGDIANAGLYIKKYNSTYSELGLKQSRMWPKGTLCITIAANIGRTAILDFKSCFPDSIVGFIPNKKTNSEFIHFWFSFWQKILETNAPQVAQKNINLEILRDLKIINPDISSQNSFKQVVSEVELIRDNISLTLIQSETLFYSLLQKAFTEEGLSIQKGAAISEIAASIMEKLKQQVETLPQNKTVQNLTGRINKYLQSLPALAGNIVPSASKEISAAVQKLVPSASDMLNFLVEKGVQSFSDIENRQLAQEIIGHPFFSENRETKQVAKLILEKVDRQQKIKEQEAEEAEQNDPVIQYLNRTQLGEVVLGGLRINLVKFVKKHFSGNEFADLGNWLAEEADITNVSDDEIENAVFVIIDRLIAAELWEQPFDFSELQQYLSSLCFLPNFKTLNTYVFTALQKEPLFLQQVFMDENVQYKSRVVYQLMQDRQYGSSQWKRKIYLLHN